MQRKEAVKQSLPPTTLIELMASDPSSIRSGTDHLIAYIQRNASYEVQKAWAISVMGTAMSTWANGIMEAAKYAAECTGFSVETIRRWATSFFLTEYWAEPDSTTDDVLTEELASERGHSPTYLSSLIHNEEFKFEARTYMRMHACRKGEPNVTLAMFAKWVQENYGVTIKEEVARRWLGALGFERIHHQKGVYFDRHDREDVVKYRNEFLEKMVELDRKSLTCDGTTPQLDRGEKPFIRVVHDESTYHANSDQTYFWGDKETNVLHQKSLGASIMVSDFIEEVNGFL